MRLVSLTANKPSFHAVDFSPVGPSLIIGIQSDTTAEGRTTAHTYNGVGKSLLLYLINFCLGADVRARFVEQLEGWEFSLTCQLAEGETKLTRRVSDPDNVLYGAESISVDELRRRLQAELFPAVTDQKFLTFRSLIGLFLRPGKTAYNAFDGIHYSEKPIQKLLRSAYLLGLDTKLILTKYELREEIKRVADMSSRFAKDPIIKEYFFGKKDVNLDIRDLREQLRHLETSLRDFKVAENYHDVERRAEERKRELQDIRNQSVVVEAKISQIKASMSAGPEVSLDYVRRMYSEATVALPKLLLRSLEEVEGFHHRLLKMRQERLKSDLNAYETRLTSLQTQMKKINAQLDGELKFLSEHGALGELLSLSDRANDVRVQLQKLLDFKELTKKYKDRLRQLQADLAASHIGAAQYLDDNQDWIDQAAEMFRSIARRIYPDKQSGLTIENDEGDNQTRFKIDAKILADASDGINEAKIFAYDMTLTALRRNHNVRFLCHDSRLFSDIDPRQRGEIFKIAEEYSTHYDFQYIATANQDQIEAMRPMFTPDQFRDSIERRTVLKLSDNSPEDRLLGCEIDLDYD